MSHFCVYVFHNDNQSIDELLEPFNENIERSPYIYLTKKEAIKKCRREIEEYNNNYYKEYINNPIEYKLKWGSDKRHISYLENEFPKMLNWNDEECYNYEKSFYDEDLIDEDGNIMTTYNPNSKWDWYEVGGRWYGIIEGKNESAIKDINIDKLSIPFAFVTSDGEWIERGKMGWFGISKDNMEYNEWDNKFREYVKSLDKDMIITQVDCHI